VRTRVRVGLLSLMAPAFAWLLGMTAAHADTIRVQATHQGNRAQVVLAWPAPVGFSTETREGSLFVRFDRPIDGDFWAIRKLRRFTRLPTVGEDGRSLIFPLQQDIAVVAYAAGEKVVLDFSPAQTQPGAAEASTAAAPAAQDLATGADRPRKVSVHTGQHAGYSRIVFNWGEPVRYSLESAAGTATIVFDRPAEIDPRQFQRRYLKYIRGGTTERVGAGTKVTLQIAEGASVRDLQDERQVVFDVLAPPTASGRVAQTAATPEDLRPSAPEAGDAAAPPAAPQPRTPPSSEQPAAAGPSAEPDASSAAPAPAVAARSAIPAKEEAALRFHWDGPVAAAMFRRGETLWCVFDSPSRQDTAALAEGAGARLRQIEQQPHEKATVLRISAEAGVEPRLERDGLTWILRFSPGEASAGEPIAPTPDLSSAAGARLLLPVAGPGSPLAVTDPEIGDTLVVVPVIPLASRISRTHTYPQFRLLASLQGIVVQPLIDTLRVRSLRDGVDITSSDDLAISPVATTTQSGSRMAPPVDPDRLLDARGWTDGASAGFVARRQTLERSVIESAGAERELNRVRLAQFLLGHRFAAEALGVLTLATEERPALATEPRFLLLRGAARLMAGRVAEARDDLARAGASGIVEAGLWLGAARAAAGESPADLSRLPQWTAIALSYPAVLRRPLTSMLAEAAVAAGKTKEAEQLIDIARPDAKSAEERAQIAYLEGMRKQANGDIEGALASYEQAAGIDPRRGRARAEFARTMLLRREGRISVEQAIAALDALRFAWRDDEVELRLLRELGRLYLQAGDYPAALRTLKLAASDFPGLPASGETTREMARAFEHLYLEGGADRLPPVKALALYDEFKELTPAGGRGTEMVSRLAERLVQVDLLDHAASLLGGVLTQASPSEKARLGARLAEIRLLDGKPEAALEDLRRTADPGVPAELQRQRALSQARALAALGRGDEALTALGRDDSLDAELLRAKVFRGRGDWDRVAAALRRVVEAARAAPATPLGEQQARDVLDLAVALTLAGRDSQLVRLDQDYGSAMAATPLKDTFRLIAGAAPLSDADASALADVVEKAMAFRRSLTPPASPAAR
jgi:tetratricopeptide (TPR) repeat protein